MERIKGFRILRRIALFVVAAFLISYPTCLQATPANASDQQTSSTHIATPREVIESKLDLWGEAALAQPEGPTYEFFKSLIPPVRYVDADFHHYPIPLSAPCAVVKGRVVSNGSQVNALARQPNWINEMGIPVHVLIGDHREVFGDDLRNLDGPHYLDGYLPVVKLSYKLRDQPYSEELFAAIPPDSESVSNSNTTNPLVRAAISLTTGPISAAGPIYARFAFPGTDQGRVELRFESGHDFFEGSGGFVKNSAGKYVAAFDENWEWNKFRAALSSKPKHGATATAIIYTVPLDSPTTPSGMSGSAYDDQRRRCIDTWAGILDEGMSVEVPESYVNNAWRSLICGTYGIISGDYLNYSAGTQYARMYASETSDALMSLLLWGQAAEARRLMPAILRKERAQMEYHYAAFELHTLAEYFRHTGDEFLVREMRPVWEKSLTRILDGREADTGLLPRQKYCTDIDSLVYNLVANSLSWRAMRDISILLAVINEPAKSKQLEATARDYRTRIMTAVAKTSVQATNPPFHPVALGNEEEPHDPITATRIGSYWNLIIGYVLTSGVFPFDSSIASDIVRYQQLHGGLCMGMIRCLSEKSFWIDQHNVDDLYGVRYALMLQQRDEPDRALVSFYGKLAQGMTRDTFIGAEGTAIMPFDEFGRQMYLPPNSAANANFLLQLRSLLVQDWDMDDDGKPETLRLLFATPRQWLADGKTITVRRAPTAFGELSMSVHSAIDTGSVTAEIQLPPRPPKETLLRFRLPKGYKIISASAADRQVDVTSETMKLTGLSGSIKIKATVSR